jgi:hypothetical protein
MSGFICVPREVWEWDNWDRRNAYIDLQKRCSWGEQQIRTQGQTIAVQRGEVLFSAREASLWWRCTEKAVRVTMEWLESEGLIAYPEGKQHRRMFRVSMVTYFGDVEQEGARKGATKGATKGARKGASNPLQGDALGDLRAQQKAQQRAQAGAQGKAQHIEDQKIEHEKITTVPSEQCAEGEADLFGEGQPSPTAVVESENATTIAQRIVTLFHELSKASGGKGVSSEDWPTQRKMAASAVRKGLSETEAGDAIRWGMANEYQRRRLRAEGMKVLRYVWSEWVEETGEESNGRNRVGAGGAGNAGGETGAGSGTGSRDGYAIVGGMATRYPETRRVR